MMKIYYFKDMLELLNYKKELDHRLDNFVFQESVNGTFLQSRQFLNYHPENRFKDASFALERSGTIAVYFPGNEIQEPDGSKTFVSHQGSTFGGPIFSKAFYSASRVMEALKFADQLFASKYKKVRLKITPALFAKESPDVIEYALEHLGYTRHTELSSCTTLVDADRNQIADPLANCEKDCRRIFRNSEKFDIIYRAFNAADVQTGKPSRELQEFYSFLEISKAKHNVKPVHSMEELCDLEKRLNVAAPDGTTQERIRFRGIWLNDRYVAAMMLFAFPEVGVLHAQYIAPDDNFKEFHPTTTLYVNAMREAAREGFKNFSWGISTEEGGNYLNESLIKYKESLGAKPVVNVYYTKDF
ncbi:MAG: GNAT family N-acetyltransferase [Fibrobacter sp.]|nr:GNAT family N-acetyltransferase [Fibrobacter sp.]